MFLRLIPLGALCVLAGFGVFAEPAAALAEPTTLPVEETILTLDEALARALRSSPDLTVAREELHAVEADLLQAGRLPNPELSVTLENVAGDGIYRDTDAAELTIELAMPVELGGKYRLRREAAELGRQLAANRQKLTLAEVLAMTRQSFIAVLAAQDGLILASEQAELADKSLTAAEDRIKAGKSPAIDRLRLKGEAGLAGLAVSKAERTLALARVSLAANWGEAQPDFKRVAGDLATLPAAPELSEAETTLEQSPDVVSRRIATELLNNQLEQSRARRLPDPRLTIGWRQFEESDENAWVFGVSIPLPLFNQGQHEVAAASSRLNSAKAQELSGRTQARSKLISARQAFADARTEAEVFDNQVVPAAAEGFAAAEFGYRAGKFGLIELLDAQRALFEARQRQLSARTACQLAAIELQRLQSTDAGTATP